MVSNWDQVRRVFSKGGIITELGEKWAEEKDLYYLGPWLNNLASLGMKEKVVTTEAEAKGLKIRVPPIDTYRCFVEKMGFSPVTIPWAEAPTAVATGLVDGWVGSGAVYMYDLFRDVAKVMIVTYDSPETWHVTFNLKKMAETPGSLSDHHYRGSGKSHQQAPGPGGKRRTGQSGQTYRNWMADRHSDR